MINTNVVYTNAEGWKEIRKVPEGTLPVNYGSGILIGPPDLSSLKLSRKQRQELNNFLVDNNIITYENILGNKRKILDKLLEFVNSEVKAAQLRNEIIGVYQRELVIPSEED